MECIKLVPLSLFDTFTGFNERTSFLYYGINYGRKKLYDTDAGGSVTKTISFIILKPD